MNEKYDHLDIESKWQKKWQESSLYNFDPNKKDSVKKYILVEFPYPSGNLHVGHWYSFSVPDMYARFKRMQGFNTFFPFGFDSFGLPAENAAIKNNVSPADWTNWNISTMTEQVKLMGSMIDFDKLIRTSDPSFYKWTQWMFIQFFKHNIVYQGSATVNWCPKDQTILANEQVVGGKCERCESDIEQRQMPQWMFRITKYADRLISDLDNLDWPNEIKESQKNWIGKSEGALIDFEMDDGIKRNYIFIHGYKASSSHNFHSWVKNELEKKGHSVSVLDLPNPNNPNIQEQIDFVLESCTFDEKTVLVGHSLGSVVAMKVLEKINTKIDKLVLVASFIKPVFKDHNRDYKKQFDWKFDFEKIKNNTKSTLVLADENDDVFDIERSIEVKNALDARIIKTTGVEPHFRGKEEPEVLNVCLSSIKVFTTRADTLFGVTYLAIAPEHSILREFVFSNKKEVLEYQNKISKKSELDRKQSTEKTGVELQGIWATNPATKEKIPIWIADYVLVNYGTGSVMAVPAHDERDLEFAEKFSLPIKKVLDIDSDKNNSDLYLINSLHFDGLSSEIAKKKIIEFINGKVNNTYRLRDWGISRQRYWGTPIPIVYDPDGNPHPIPDEHLPWLLPTDVDFNPDGTAPLARSKELKERTEKIFGKGFTPETDTMDTFVDSSWYFLRYIDFENKEKFADPDLIKKWLPVDFYSGGAEHTTMHLLYSRFWYKALFDLGIVPTSEPYLKRVNRGLILASDGRKMSKRWGNVVDPGEQVNTFGADSVRCYLAFIGPFNETGTYPWDINGIVGIRRFVERFYNLGLEIKKASVEKKLPAESTTEIKKILHKTILKVTNDLENLKTNTAISALMIFINDFKKISNASDIQLSEEDYFSFLKIASPFMPFVTEEIYSWFNQESVHLCNWPEYDNQYLVNDSVKIIIQINGKMRSEIVLPVNTESLLVEKKVLELEIVQKWIKDKEIKKIIVIPNRLINIVIV